MCNGLASEREVVVAELGGKLGGVERARDRIGALLALALAGASLVASCGDDAAKQGVPAAQDASVDRQFQATDRGSRYTRREAAPDASASGDASAEDAAGNVYPAATISVRKSRRVRFRVTSPCTRSRMASSPEPWDQQSRPRATAL